MSSHINFVTFKNILNKNNIYLFDCHYRIAHFRYNQYINNIAQTGGNNIEPTLFLSKINKKKASLLNHFIDSLITNNTIKTNFIFTNISSN
jgi:hypothetical protein